MRYYGNELYHHGIKGQKWGVRRFQNEDGSYTSEGKARYGRVSKVDKPLKTNVREADLSDIENIAYNLNDAKRPNSEKIDRKVMELNKKLMKNYSAQHKIRQDIEKQIFGKTLEEIDDESYAYVDKQSENISSWEEYSDLYSKFSGYEHYLPSKLGQDKFNKLMSKYDKEKRDNPNLAKLVQEGESIEREKSNVYSEENLAKALLLDLGYEPSNDNIDYIMKLGL